MHIVDKAIRACEVSKVADAIIAAVCVAALFFLEEKWEVITCGFWLGAAASGYLFAGTIRQHLITNKKLLETNQDLIKFVRNYQENSVLKGDILK